MAKTTPRPMAKDELLEREKRNLAQVATWYKNTSWGFYTRLVRYSYVSIKPYFYGKSALEMGSADGEMTRYLVKDFEQLHVVDAAEKYVKSAKKLGNNIDGFTSLFEEFDPPQLYDTIIMAHVLEHLNDPVLVLKRAKQWLNSKGRIIIVVPNGNSLHRKLGVKMGLLKRQDALNEQDMEIGHRRVYDRQLLNHHIELSRLKAIAEGGAFLKLLSNSQMLQFKDDRLIEGMFELGKDFPELCSEIYAVCVLA